MHELATCILFDMSLTATVTVLALSIQCHDIVYIYLDQFSKVTVYSSLLYIEGDHNSTYQIALSVKVNTVL